MPTDIHLRLASEAEAIAQELIPQFHDHLVEARILYVFTSQKRTRGGSVVLGSAQKASPLLRFLSRRHLDQDAEEPAEADFIILLSSVAWLRLDDRQRTALVDHELCLPAGVQVTGPEVQASMRRRYAGEIVTITTAAGHFLAGTPNHPVLTDRGWVPLGFLNEGDHVVSCVDPERVAATVDPHKYQMPASIEQVAGAVDMVLPFMPEAAQDFNTDVADGQVDVVTPHGKLRDASIAEALQHRPHVLLGGRDTCDVLLAGAGERRDRFVAMPFTAPGIMRGLGVGASLFGRQLGHTDTLPLAAVADGNASLHEQRRKGFTTDPQITLYRKLRHTSGVELDQIVRVDTEFFRGHVYNLQTSQGWYIGNSIITHNCHCRGDYDDTTEMWTWRLRGHDFEGFVEEIERHGLWKHDLEDLGKAVRQPSLFSTNGHHEREVTS